MTHEAFLRSALAAVEVDAAFSEATIVMTDQSRLRFRHRVGERWAKAEAPTHEDAGQNHLAGRLLAVIAMFRLNAKHLDVQLADGTHWEARFNY
jgi:hypothetical protein